MSSTTHTQTGLAATRCHPDWRQVSADLTDLLTTVTGRSGLRVVASPGAAHGAAACYLIDLDVVELDSDRCFPGIDPDTMDVADTWDHYCYPAGIGALLHEAAHIGHSLWRADASWPALIGQIARLLEEPRIEAAQVKARPHDRQWLRACADDIVLADFDPGQLRAPLVGLWQAAKAALLCLGRVSAGVFDATDTGIGAARAALEAALTPALLGELEQVWTDALACTDNDVDAMGNCADRWYRVLTSPAAQAIAAERAEAIDEAIAAATESIGDIATQVPSPTSDPAAGEAWSTGGSGSGPGGQSTAEAGRRLFKRFTTARTTREPSTEERTAAAKLGRVLKQASQRPRHRAKAPSALPPGNLRMRGALTASAQRAAGAMVTAQPWRQRQKGLPPDPVVRVGIALDVSASMGPWLDPACAAAWMLAHAASEIGGLAAATAFGERARALLAPGEPPAKVPVPVREGCTDHADVAIAALMEQLGLAHKDGNARLLFIVGDGDLTGRQVKPVAAQCKALREAGCAVVQIGPQRSTALDHADVVIVDDPADAIDLIATTVAQALREAAKTLP
jgi:hypothetical protein